MQVAHGGRGGPGGVDHGGRTREVERGNTDGESDKCHDRWWWVEQAGVVAYGVILMMVDVLSAFGDVGGGCAGGEGAGPRVCYHHFVTVW